MAEAKSNLWLVAENMPGLYDPRAASLLCVVRVSDDELEHFEDVLRKHSMRAYKESYGGYFHRMGWTKRKPVTLQQFSDTVRDFNPYDAAGLRKAFKAIS